MSEEEDAPPHSPEPRLSGNLDRLDVDAQLMSAAQRGQSEVVRELLKNGAKVKLDANGNTGLHIAAQNGFPDVIRILLEEGVDVDLLNQGGHTALHKAATGGHLDVLELLINEGCAIDTADDTYGNTALHEAAWNGYSKSVDLLLKNKSNAFSANRAGCTPLHLAAQNGHNQTARTLIYAGCSPDVKNNYGDTPLHTAARYGHAGVTRILISAKASVSEQNKNGDSSLHIASAFKRRKIAKLLVEAHIDSQLINKQNETAVDIARRKDHGQIIDIINLGGVRSTGVRLTYGLPSTPDQSSGVTSDSREATPENNKAKRKTGLISWIKKRLHKEKNTAAEKGSPSQDDGNSGLFSQYVKRQGYAYYRDLAGNIRQGPIGYAPTATCQCESRVADLEERLVNTKKHVYNHMDSSHHLLNERICDMEHNTTAQVRLSDTSNQQRLAEEREQCIERLHRQRDTERNVMSQQLAQVESHLKGDLQSWLVTQMSEPPPNTDPFAYTIGNKQLRFCDDFDHQRIARFEASEQFPPPPRLFRSRSDETLSHSEYSFHGRAYKSREAAMEELKTLRQHEQLRDRRKKLRSGTPAESHDIREDNSKHRKSRSRQRDSVEFREHADLWRSKEHLSHPEHLVDSTPTQTPTKQDIATPKSTVTTPNGNDVITPCNDPVAPQSRDVTLHDRPAPNSDSKVREQADSANKRSSMGSQLSKAETPLPLKSALRQPRQDEAEDSKPRLSRSSSLPRESKLEVVTPNNRDKKKSVHYDETVKSAEISPLCDEVLFPSSKREAPIGGHDAPNVYKEQGNASSYQAISSALIGQGTQPPNTHDLRDSIVNARNELLARNKGIANGHQRQWSTPSSGETAKSPVTPPYHVTQQNYMTNASHVAPRLQPITGRETQQPNGIPFAQYADQITNNPYNSLPRRATPTGPKPNGYSQYTSQQMTTPNVSRPPVQKRLPLPTYDEIQSRRQSVATPCQTNSNYKAMVYPAKRPTPSNRPPLLNYSPKLHTENNNQPWHPQFSQSDCLNQVSPAGTNQSNATGSSSSSNPDSGYGHMDYYGTPVSTSQASDYDSWYEMKLQAADRKINPGATPNRQRFPFSNMMSDV